MQLHSGYSREQLTLGFIDRHAKTQLNRYLTTTENVSKSGQHQGIK
jgi:hypothetical protein